MTPIDDMSDGAVIAPSTGDEAGVINSNLANDKKTIIFSKGTHTINSNVTFPRNVQVIMEEGAKLKIAGNVTVTLDADFVAPQYPVFIGDGKVKTNVKGRVLYPQWFGASGLTGTGGRGIVGKGTVTAGSTTVSVTDGIDRFNDGNTVIIIGAGKNPSLPKPAAPALKLGTYDTKTGKVTTGTTPYTYQIAAVTKDGAYSLPSNPVTVPNGPDPSYFEYFQGTRVEMTMPAAPSGVDGWAIYGALTNPPGHQGLLGVIWNRSAKWYDYGPGRWDNSVPPWIPTVVPTQTGSRFLVTTIVSGGGTSSLTLKDSASTSVQSAMIMADDSIAFQKCYDLLEQAGGGTIELPKGRYYLHIQTETGSRTSVYFKSNVTLISYEKAIVQGYTNFVLDNMMLFAASKGTADNFAFKGIVFNGGNETCTTEYGYWAIATVDGPGGSGTGSHNNFRIEDCEFVYFTGKALWLGGGNPQNYSVSGNYIHKCNSNAMTVSGTQYVVRNNYIDTCIQYGLKSYIRAAESIILMNTNYGIIDGNFIRNWGNISSGGPQIIKNLQIVNNTMNDTNGIRLGGTKENVTVSGNTLNINTTDYISGQAIQIESSGSTSPCTNVAITDNIINTSGRVQSLSMSVDGGSAVKQINISNNIINHKDSSFVPVSMRYVTGLQFNHNEIICTNVTGGNATDMAIELVFDTKVTDSGWVVTGNDIPGKNLAVPSGAVVTGNRAGGLRIGSNSVVTGNRITGTAGPNTWGGLVNVSGSNNVISNNTIDMAGTASSTSGAINENSQSYYNVITGNRILNYGTRSVASLIVHNQNSTVMLNVPYDRKQIMLNKTPAAGTWVPGDMVLNNAPSPSTPYIGWICTVGGTAIDAGKAWAANRKYNVNDQVYANGKIYTATAAGTSSATAPTHINGTAPGGTTLIWQFTAFQAIFNPFGTITYSDKAPPSAPTGLTAVPGNKQATLTWKANTEADLAGYNLYPKQNGTKINSELIRTTGYTVTGLTEGTFAYELTAVDTAGNQSGRSASVSVTVAGS